MESFRQDLRFAFRALARTPGFTLIALITIAIGTGANATVFGFVSALLLRPAPAVVDPATLFSIHTADFSSGPYGRTSYPDLVSIATGTSAFRLLAAEQDDAIAVVRTGEGVERVRQASVTGSYFDALGLRARMGRLLGESDTHASAPPAAVISSSFWDRVFGGERSVLGRSLVVSGRAYTIVGIAPEHFEGLDLGRPCAVWTALIPPPSAPDARGSRRLSVVARLRDGGTLGEARAQLDALALRLAREYPATNLGTSADPHAPRGFTIGRHTRLRPEFRGQVTMLATVLMAAVGLVLLIACANVASLLLARAMTRGREMAIRLALGARPRRVVRQLLTEHALLGLAGGLAGLLLSLWTADALPSFFPEEQARTLDTGVDLTTLAFVFGLSLLSTILFGLPPALQAVRSRTESLVKSPSARVSDTRAATGLRRLVVAAQVALAVVLLVSAALVIQTVRNAFNADLGFAARAAVLATVELPPSEFPEAQGAQYYEAAAGAVRALPGIESVAFVRSLPLSGRDRRAFRIPGYQPLPGESLELQVNVLGAGAIETLGMRLVAGREFDAGDRADGARVAMVDDLIARKYFGGDALGRRLVDPRGVALEVVGIVKSGEPLPAQNAAEPTVYYPLAQEYAARMTIVARTTGDAVRSVDAVRRTLAAVDRRVPVFRAITLSAHLDEVFAAERLTAALLTLCGAMAALLAAVGLYGVVAFSVLRRSREIGVRLALGASPAHVLRLVVREGLGVTAGGLAAGLALAFSAAHGLAFMLFGVQPGDLATFLAVPTALAVVAVLASIGPARRALRVDPMSVLRQE